MNDDAKGRHRSRSLRGTVKRIGPRRLGRVWLLRKPFPVLLGLAAAHLVATLHGLPIGFALTGAKADERQVLLDLLHDDPALAASRPGQILIADKYYYGRDFEADLVSQGIRLLRRACKGEPERPGGRFFKPLRQTVESIYDTLEGQLDLEQHGGHTACVLVRVLLRVLALTTAIWHNDRTGRPVKRSLLACDH